MTVDITFPIIKIMTLAHWTENSNDYIYSEVKKILFDLEYNSIHDFPSIIVQESSLKEESIRELVNVVGQCFIHNPMYTYDFITPIIPFNASLQPILHIDPSFKDIENPIKSLALSYCINLIEWFLRYKKEGESSDFENQGKVRAFFLQAEFNAEYISFSRYIKLMAKKSLPVNANNIKRGLMTSLQGFRDPENINLQLRNAAVSINCVDFFAKDLVFKDHGKTLWNDDQQDRDNAAYLDKELGSYWKALKAFFNRSRSFEEAISAQKELEAILKLADDTILSSVKEAVAMSDQCIIAFQQKDFNKAVSLGERAAAVLRKSDETSLAICLTNLHSAYCANSDASKAETLYPEAITAAEKVNDFLSVASLAVNAMSLHEMNTPRLHRF